MDSIQMSERRDSPLSSEHMFRPLCVDYWLEYTQFAEIGQARLQEGMVKKRVSARVFCFLSSSTLPFFHPSQRIPFARCLPHQRRQDIINIRIVGTAMNIVEPEYSFIIQEISSPKKQSKVLKAIVNTKIPCFSGFRNTIKAPIPRAMIIPPDHRSQAKSTGLPLDKDNNVPGKIR